jgi:hypothetical protein
VLKWKKIQTSKVDMWKIETVRLFIDKPKLFDQYKACLTDNFLLEPTAFIPSAANENENENVNVDEANEAREPTEADKNAVRSEKGRLGRCTSLQTTWSTAI